MVFRVRFMEIRWTRKPHYISDTWCLTSATPECNVRSETSVTEPSRLNAPIVLWRLNNLTLPARVGLNCRRDGWSPLRVCSRLASPQPCIAHFVGDLGPSKWEFWRCEWWKMCIIYQDICFWRNCPYVANVTEFIATESEAGQERFANVSSLLFSLLSSGWKTVAQKEVLNSA